jgi:hypothetical protein
MINSRHVLGTLAVTALLAGRVTGAEVKLAAGSVAKSAVTEGSAPTDRFARPIPMGISIGNTKSAPFTYAGTAGLKVQAVSNPSLHFILSNNHVLGAVGPTLCPSTAPRGLFLLQPGTIDIGTDPGAVPFYEVGVFIAHAPMLQGNDASNMADAAISFTTDALAKSEILNIGEPNPVIGTPMPGMRVIKSGRTTRVTTGTIASVNATVFVTYGTGCPTYRFVNQVEIDSATFSGSGDSGSAILDASTLTPVALLFAGSPSSTIGSDIRNVYQQLSIAPVGSTATSDTVNESLRNEDTEFTRMRGIRERNEDALLGLAGVVGVGLSRDSSGWYLKVFTQQLTPELQRAIPQAVEGARVRVVESGEFRAY